MAYLGTVDAGTLTRRRIAVERVTRRRAVAVADVEPPTLKAIVSRLCSNLVVVCVIPGLLLYCTLIAANLETAMIVALAWSAAVMVWRWATNRAASGLLALSLLVMTMRTAFALLSGDSFIYFMQPIVMDGVLAVAFVGSLATSRPVVARLAPDFFPIDNAIAQRPRVAAASSCA